MPINFSGLATQEPILILLLTSGNFFRLIFLIFSIVFWFTVVGFKSEITDDKSLVTPSSSIIAELANKYFDEWVVEKPYSVVPNYISPFNIGVKKP